VSPNICRVTPKAASRGFGLDQHPLSENRAAVSMQTLGVNRTLTQIERSHKNALRVAKSRATDSMHTGWRGLREMTRSKGALRAPYDYDPFGVPL